MHRLFDKKSRYQNFHSISENELRHYFDKNIDEDVPLSPLSKYFYYVLANEDAKYDVQGEIKEINNYLLRKPQPSDFKSFKSTYQKLSTLFMEILIVLKNDSITGTYFRDIRIDLLNNYSQIQSNCNDMALQLAFFLNGTFSKTHSEEKLIIYLPYLISIYAIKGFIKTSCITQSTASNDIKLYQEFSNLKLHFENTANKDYLFANIFKLSNNNCKSFEKHFIKYQITNKKSSASNELTAFCKICRELYYKLRMFCLIAPLCQNAFTDCDDDLSFILFVYHLFPFSDCREFFIFFIFFFATTIIQVDYESYLETQEQEHFAPPSQLFNKFISIEHAFASHNSDITKYISQFFYVKENKCTIMIDNIPSSFLKHPDKDEYYISLDTDPFTAILYTRIPIEYNGEPSQYYQKAPLLADPQLYRVQFEHQILKWQNAIAIEE